MQRDAGARLWVKLVLPGVGQVGPGKVELLRRIRELRSISAAARAMEMSYRRAWLLVDEMNRLFEQPVVEKWQGGRTQGGAALTRFGEQLIESYDTLLAQSNDVNKRLLRRIGRSAGRKAAAKPG